MSQSLFFCQTMHQMFDMHTDDDTQSAEISQKQDGHNIYVIMKTMCPPGYHRNGFMATHALGHIMCP